MPLIAATRGKREYVKIAIYVLGRPLPKGVVVHHVDEDRSNNANDNLCILQNAREHQQLHRRLRILRAGGNPWTQQICTTCRQVKDLDQFPPSKRTKGHNCLSCSADLNNIRYHVARGRPARRLTRDELSAIQRENAMRRWYPEKVAGGVRL